MMIKVDVGSNEGKPIEMHVGDGFAMSIQTAIRLQEDLEAAVKDALYKQAKAEAE